MCQSHMEDPAVAADTAGRWSCRGAVWGTGVGGAGWPISLPIYQIIAPVQVQTRAS